MDISETDLKQQLKDYLSVKGIFNYHLLQGIGSYKGIPDRILHYGGRVIYLEIKKPGGKLSKYQVVFEQQCCLDDIRYVVVHSLEELQEALK